LSKNGRSAAHLSIAGEFEGLLDAGAEAIALKIWSNTSVQTASIISEIFFYEETSAHNHQRDDLRPRENIVEFIHKSLGSAQLSSQIQTILANCLLQQWQIVSPFVSMMLRIEFLWFSASGNN